MDYILIQPYISREYRTTLKKLEMAGKYDLDLSLGGSWLMSIEFDSRHCKDHEVNYRGFFGESCVGRVAITKLHNFLRLYVSIR